MAQIFDSDSPAEQARRALPCDGDIAALAEFFRTVGSETRLKILLALGTCELCAGDLADAVGMAPSAVSNQLRALRQARLITVRRLIPFRVEALRGTANVLLILALCVAVTLTGGAGHILSPTAWWLVAGGLGLVLLGINGKALYEMGACAVRAVLRKSRKREQTADPSAPEKGDTTGS